jgi:pimeloyl-ACP methyl ester carboxylesterase
MGGTSCNIGVSRGCSLLSQVGLYLELPSYGTILGSTFATMFPDNVGRLVIDGVVDMDNYYEGWCLLVAISAHD